MKKLIKIFIITFLLVGGATLHVHDDQCGYDPKNQTGCIYDEINPQQGEGPNY